MKRAIAVMIVLALVVSGCSGPTIRSNVDHATAVEIMPAKTPSGQPTAVPGATATTPVRRSLGATPCETDLTRGVPHRIQVSAPGYQTRERVVQAHRSGGLVALVITADILATCCTLFYGWILVSHIRALDSDPGFCAVFDDSDLTFALVPGGDSSTSEPRHDYAVPEPLPSPSPSPQPRPSPSPSPSPSPRPRPSPSPSPTPSPSPAPSPTLASPASTESPASGSRTRFCTHCGAKFATDEQRFCTGCGAAR